MVRSPSGDRGHEAISLAELAIAVGLRFAFQVAGRSRPRQQLAGGRPPGPSRPGPAPRRAHQPVKPLALFTSALWCTRAVS